KHVRPVDEDRAEVGVLEPRLDEAKSWLAPKDGQVPLLDRPRIVVGEAIEADDIRAVGAESFCKRRPDEPGHAGDQRLHGVQRRATRCGVSDVPGDSIVLSRSKDGKLTT